METKEILDGLNVDNSENMTKTRSDVAPYLTSKSNAETGVWAHLLSRWHDMLYQIICVDGVTDSQVEMELPAEIPLSQVELDRPGEPQLQAGPLHLWQSLALDLCQLGHTI